MITRLPSPVSTTVESVEPSSVPEELSASLSKPYPGLYGALGLNVISLPPVFKPPDELPSLPGPSVSTSVPPPVPGVVPVSVPGPLPFSPLPSGVPPYSSGHFISGSSVVQPI